MLPPLKAIAYIDEKDLFAASYVKLARAKHFINELESELRRYIDSKPLSPEIVSDGDGFALDVEWAGITMLPGAIIGDTVHNLRTALDLMASELARINGNPDDDVYFPFARSPDQFEHVIKSRHFDRAGDDAVALLRTFAPYRGGNEALRGLHDLDIRDKHTAIVPIGHSMNISYKLEYRTDSPEKATASVEGNDIWYIFAPDTGFPKARIIETLKDLMQLVHGIVEAFAGLVRARPNTT
jgi:hypothetical protein